MSTEMEKIKKRLDELEADVKKHTSGVMYADKKRLDEIDVRLKAFEGKGQEETIAYMRIIVFFSSVFRARQELLPTLSCFPQFACSIP